MRRFLAGCIGLIMMVSQLPFATLAETPAVTDAAETENISSVVKYTDYISGYDAAQSEGFEQSVYQPSQYFGDASVTTVSGVEATVFYADESGAVYTVLVPKDGWYHIAVNYCPLESKSSEIQFSFKINGCVPYDEAENLTLNRFYRDSGIGFDFNGNDIRTAKSEIFDWNYTPLYDSFRIYSEPLLFHLQQGENQIGLDFTYAAVAIEYVSVYSASKSIGYREYTASVESNPDLVGPDDAVIIQAETPDYTTSKALYPTYDRQSSMTLSEDNTENSPRFLKLNTIGQSTWKQPGQTISYRFTLEKDGFYQIGIRAKQNEARGIFSTRRVRIDGEVPFDELSNLQVPFGNGWQIVMLGGDTPYSFWFSAGEHTIELEAVSGILGEYTNELEDIVALLNNLYREIIMVTGTSPDTYRDYKLERQIPDLQERMTGYSSFLQNIKDDILENGVQKGSDMVVIDQLVRLLDSFAEKPRTIPDRLSNFQDAISSFSSWILSLKEQPLEMDYIFIEKFGSEIRDANAGIIASVVFRIKMFLASFMGDYYEMSSEEYEDSPTLKVWVNLGRDQTQVISDLINNEFKPQYKVNVELSLVKQSLVTAIAADRQPDVSLYAGDIVNLAARNALLALDGIEGFGETKTWFSENAFLPYTYNGSVYGIPLEQNFLMMFYRVDIFSELGITPPATWEELCAVITTLQKNKLTAGIPASASIFEALLFQSGCSFYNEDYSATAFDDERAVAAFTKWTEFYTKYRLPQSYSVLVRFRSGEMPLFIDNYTTYNTLAVGAPEISGLWKMTAIPGTYDGDGRLDNTTVSGGSAGVILKSCKDTETAFSFLRWFASADVQAQYGINIENILGSGSRYDPANLEALSQMNWSAENAEILTAQIRQSSFEPVIPASYYVGRNLNNAYRAVTIKGQTPREALYSYNVDINAEIQRKRAELGID